MKRLVAAAAVALLFTSAAHASSTTIGDVSLVSVLKNGTVLFNHNGDRTARPACATNMGRWAFDGSTPAGQAKLSLLLTAYSSGKKIVVVGDGACGQGGDTETIDYIYTAN
ncbi:hypothetical protein DMC18_23635 [Caulobacter sp. D5]|uniref:hypothetical protein n=1 Tax=Caulobacter sp. D5 TaxID=357400 RepID=UPI000D72A0BB|nr:hypothetical protein [Caulobacter sp. D5]PXA84659.1 hypothetical protein DMC18_23635 [Caulobacter sp. D5]